MNENGDDNDMRSAPVQHYPLLGRPSSAQSAMAFLHALLLQCLAQSEIVSQQFFSIEFAGKFMLSNAFLFRANQMFHAMAMKMVTHSFLCTGCTNLGLVIESCTDPRPCM
jgi:hypothetical protein